MNENKDIKNTEEKKQSSKYLSYIYSENRVPKTSYPIKFAKFITLNSFGNIKGRLIDVGCGRGDMLRAFKEMGHEVSGVDLSLEAIKLCEPIPVEQIDLENTDLDFEANQCDYVFSKSVIEHLKNPLEFMKSCKKILKPSGKMVVLTPSWFHQSWGPFYQDFTHIRPFTQSSLRDLIILAGFKSVKIKYFYQLPVLWKYPILKPFIKLVNLLPIPYLPMYDGMMPFKWPNEINKFIRFSKEVMIYAECEK
tara:strand:- start:294 stop:1043 length:750 start_codon:yes stop_codon:yes gene_type:complete